MSEKLSKLLQWFLYALMIISVILGVLFYLDPEMDTELSSGANRLMYWAYALLIFGVVVALVASIFSLLTNPKGGVKVLIIFGLMVVIAIVSYSLSTNEFTAIQLEKMKSTESASILVGGGLIFTYVLAALAFLAIIVSSASRIFK